MISDIAWICFYRVTFVVVLHKPVLKNVAVDVVNRFRLIVHIKCLWCLAIEASRRYEQLNTKDSSIKWTKLVNLLENHLS